MPKRVKLSRPPAKQPLSWPALVGVTIFTGVLGTFGWVLVVKTIDHIRVYGPFEGFGGRFGDGSSPLVLLLLAGVLAGVGTYWTGFGIVLMWRKVVEGGPARPKDHLRRPPR